MNFSDNLKKYRNLKGLSQKNLANLIGVSQTAVYSWEKGKMLPKLEQLSNLARVLDVSVIDLIDVETLNLADSVLEVFSQEAPYSSEVAGSSTTQENYLISTFRELNPDGQAKVTEYAEDLTKIPAYRKQSDTSEESTPPDVLAAHTRTDIEQTPEGTQHDLDIMNDDSEWNKE